MRDPQAPSLERHRASSLEAPRPDPYTEDLGHGVCRSVSRTSSMVEPIITGLIGSAIATLVDRDRERSGPMLPPGRSENHDAPGPSRTQNGSGSRYGQEVTGRS